MFGSTTQIGQIMEEEGSRIGMSLRSRGKGGASLARQLIKAAECAAGQTK